MVDDKGRTHCYRWQSSVPLHGQADAIIVNYFEYLIIDTKGKTTFENSWVTDITLTESNVKKMASAGRCRWKIEKELKEN